VVEDEAGPRLPEKGALVKGDEQIDLHAFYDEFIRPDGESRTSSRRWRTTRPKRNSTNCSAASTKVTTAGSRQVKRLRQRPFFLASDGDRAVAYGAQAYA